MRGNAEREKVFLYSFEVGDDMEALETHIRRFNVCPQGRYDAFPPPRLGFSMDWTGLEGSEDCIRPGAWDHAGDETSFEA